MAWTTPSVWATKAKAGRYGSEEVELVRTEKAVREEAEAGGVDGADGATTDTMSWRGTTGAVGAEAEADADDADAEAEADVGAVVRGAALLAR